MPHLELYEDSLEVLQEHLPDWWAKEDASSILYAILTAIADQQDDLSEDLEALFADMALVTATLDGLREEYAYAHGIEYEQLPPTVDALREYLRAWIAANGSKESVVQTLVAFLKTPVNLTGTQLVFAADGSGLTFPADGSGLVMFQQTEDTAYLVFATDGTGITFPPPEGSLVGQINVIAPSDGSTPPGATGDGLIFPLSGWVDVVEDFQVYAWTVYTKSYLNFDRAAFARAVERLRQAHLLPATIIEQHS